MKRYIPRNFILGEPQPDPQLGGEYLITVTWVYRPGFLGRLFGAKSTEFQQVYSGDSTVWHDASTGKRAPTFMESALADRLWLYKRNRGAR